MDSRGKVALESCQITRTILHQHAINAIAQRTIGVIAVPIEVGNFPPNEERLWCGYRYAGAS